MNGWNPGPPVVIRGTVFSGDVCAGTDVRYSVFTPIDVHSEKFGNKLLIYYNYNVGVRTM